MKIGKLRSKFISPFKIIRYKGEVIYILALLFIYIKLYNIFNISLLKEYIPKLGENLNNYIKGIFLNLKEDNNK